MITWIAIRWCLEDVLHLAKSRGIRLSKAQASEVLEAAERRHDASVGINWDVLACHIDQIARKPRKRT